MMMMIIIKIKERRKVAKDKAKLMQKMALDLQNI